MSQNRPNKLTALHLLVYLRQRLLIAIEQNNIGELQNLSMMFGMLWDFVDKYNITGNINVIIENFEKAALDHARGIGWKSIIPSEEEITTALQSKEID